MMCDWLLGEGYTCNNEHDDPSGFCSTHRNIPGGGSSVSGLRRERDRLYDQAASDAVEKGRLREQLARAEGQVEHKDEALVAAVKQMGEFQEKYLTAAGLLHELSDAVLASSASDEACLSVAHRARRALHPGDPAEPDAKCVTTGDGGCVADDCMHSVPIVHKYRPGTTGVLCGIPACDSATTSGDRKETTCPACLRLWTVP